METNKLKEKEFDAVKMMREIRDKIHSETKGMTYEQLRVDITVQFVPVISVKLCH